MLVIRDAQLEALRAPARAQRVALAAARLRERHGPALAQQSDTALRALCERGLAAAARHGCVLPDDEERYLDLVVLLGEDFDTAPGTRWAGEILGSRLLDGSARLTQIEQHRAMRPHRSPSP